MNAPLSTSVNPENGRPSWLTTLNVDLDGLDNAEFWKDYGSNGLVATALHFWPHLEAMPERSVAALSAFASAPRGGVLFHWMVEVIGPGSSPCSFSLPSMRNARSRSCDYSRNRVEDICSTGDG